MKEEYFNSKNINTISDKIKQYLESNIIIRKHNFTAANSALLVLDMQKYFLDSRSHAFIPSSTAVIANINKLVGTFEKYNLPIIFTKHLNDQKNADMMRTWWKELITVENELSQLTEKILHKNHLIIIKNQYDAFYNTDIDVLLKNLGIKNLVITGVMTHLCCESTIRSAFIRNFETFFPIDGTADYNLEFHKSSFLNLSHGFTNPIKTNDIFIEMEQL